MYKFKHHEHFSCPPKVAFDATTSEFAGLEKYIPNVTKIDVLQNEKRPDGVVYWMLNFHGDGAIPVMARSMVKKEMLRWKEELICDPAAMTIEWKIITAFFTEHFHCGGKTSYKETAGGGCDMTIDGYLNITLSHFPGLPDSLVKKAMGALEPFLGRFVSPNLGKFYSAIKKRMKDQGKLK